MYYNVFRFCSPAAILWCYAHICILCRWPTMAVENAWGLFLLGSCERRRTFLAVDWMPPSSVVQMSLNTIYAPVDRKIVSEKIDTEKEELQNRHQASCPPTLSRTPHSIQLVGASLLVSTTMRLSSFAALAVEICAPSPLQQAHGEMT